MRDEFDSMTANQVWELIDLSSRCRSIGDKLVLKVKPKVDGSGDKLWPVLWKDYTQRKI